MTFGLVLTRSRCTWDASRSRGLAGVEGVLWGTKEARELTRNWETGLEMELGLVLCCMASNEGLREVIEALINDEDLGILNSSGAQSEKGKGSSSISERLDDTRIDLENIARG